MKTIKHTSAFSLIEVLIAMLILAIGVLGIAGLQYQSLRFSTEALYRSQASFLANDIFSRIQLNANNANTYVMNYTVGTNTTNCTQIMAASITAAEDLICIYDAADTVLPDGSTIAIAQNNSNGEAYNVTISWNNNEGDTSNALYSFQLISL